VVFLTATPTSYKPEATERVALSFRPSALGSGACIGGHADTRQHVRTLVRRQIGLERLSTNNEIAGFKFATVGVIYAVLLAFAVIVVWEMYSDAETAVVEEAGASATIFRLVEGSDPESVATRAAMADYLCLAIDRDWPMMAREKESPDVTKALDVLYALAVRTTEKQTRDRAVYYELFKQLDFSTHPTSAVLSEAGYFAKPVTLSLALRSSGNAGRGVGRVGAAAALVAG
jgi:hypothetical protein